MNLDEIKLKMQQAQDRANAEHFAKTSPDVKNITGVRIPYMRKLAKEIAKGDTKYFLDNYNIETHEEFLLKGIVILSSKFSLEEKFAYLEKYVPEIYDWSGCDVLESTLKCKDDELHLVYDFIMKYRYSKNEYETRFMIVMLFNFLREDYLDKIKEILETENFDKYYTQMAAAWLISVMFIKYRDYTLSYLNNNSLDDFTYNKALQKIRESNRASKEDKELVKKMKRK